VSRDRADGDGKLCSECGEEVPVVLAGQRSGPPRATCSLECGEKRRVRRQRERRKALGRGARPKRNRSVDIPAPPVSRVREKKARSGPVASEGAGKTASVHERGAPEKVQVSPTRPDSSALRAREVGLVGPSGSFEAWMWWRAQQA